MLQVTGIVIRYISTASEISQQKMIRQWKQVTDILDAPVLKLRDTLDLARMLQVTGHQTHYGHIRGTSSWH